MTKAFRKLALIPLAVIATLTFAGRADAALSCSTDRTTSSGAPSVDWYTTCYDSGRRLEISTVARCFHRTSSLRPDIYVRGTGTGNREHGNCGAYYRVRTVSVSVRYL